MINPTSADSTILMNKDTDVVKPVSLFAGHELKPLPLHNGPVINNAPRYYWPGVVLLFIFCLLVSIKITDPKKIYRIILSSFSLQVAKQLYREDYRLSKRVSVFLSIGFVLTLAFLVHIVNNYFGLMLRGVNPLKQYLFFVAVVVSMYLVKLLTNYFLSFVFKTEELFREYVFNVFVFCQTAGIVLFPFVICLQYAKCPPEWLLYPGMVIYAGFYILRMLRGFVISMIEQNIGILYIFLYLCALEILPFLVLIKFLLVNF